MQPRGRGVDRAFCGRGAAAPARPHLRDPAPARPEEESRLLTEEARQPRAAPVGALPGRGAERRRAGNRAARAEPPPPRRSACPPTRPARRYLRRRLGAANRKLESARGAAAALVPRPETRPPQPGVRPQPGSSDLAAAATRRAPRALPAVLRLARTSSPARTFPKVRAWGHGPRTGDLLPVAERT